MVGERLDFPQGYDEGEDVREVVDLLRASAPDWNLAQAESAACRASELRAIGNRHGLLLWLKVSGAVAAGIALTLLLILPQSEAHVTPNDSTGNNTANEIGRGSETGNDALKPADEHFSATVSRILKNGEVLLDAGAKDGLRPGDALITSEGENGTVARVGVFFCVARVDGQALNVGERVVFREESVLINRARSSSRVGGDRHALLDFGAVFDPLDKARSRELGLGDSGGLSVADVTGSLIRNVETLAQEPTLAGRIGLRAGDVLLDVNGKQVTDIDSLAGALEWSRGSGILAITVLRNGTRVVLESR